jgi:hypothetical protein
MAAQNEARAAGHDQIGAAEYVTATLAAVGSVNQRDLEVGTPVTPVTVDDGGRASRSRTCDMKRRRNWFHGEPGGKEVSETTCAALRRSGQVPRQSSGGVACLSVTLWRERGSRPA